MKPNLQAKNLKPANQAVCSRWNPPCRVRFLPFSQLNGAFSRTCHWSIRMHFLHSESINTRDSATHQDSAPAGSNHPLGVSSLLRAVLLLNKTSPSCSLSSCACNLILPRYGTRSQGPLSSRHRKGCNMFLAGSPSCEPWQAPVCQMAGVKSGNPSGDLDLRISWARAVTQ